MIVITRLPLTLISFPHHLANITMIRMMTRIGSDAGTHLDAPWFHWKGGHVHFFFQVMMLMIMVMVMIMMMIMVMTMMILIPGYDECRQKGDQSLDEAD